MVQPPILGRKGAIKVQPVKIDGTTYKVVASDPAVECAYITDWDLKVKKDTMDNTPIGSSPSYTETVNGKSQTYYQTGYEWSELLALGISWSGSASCYYNILNSDSSKHAQRLLQNCILSRNTESSKANIELYINYVAIGTTPKRYYSGKAMLSDVDIHASSDDVVSFNVSFDGCGPLTYNEG